MGWLLLSLILGAAGYLCLPLVLQLLLGGWDLRVSYRKCAALYFVPSPAKYIPGRAWSTLLCIWLGRRLGLALPDIAGGVLWLNVLTVLASVAVALLVFPKVFLLAAQVGLGVVYVLRNYDLSGFRLLGWPRRNPSWARWPDTKTFILGVVVSIGFWLLLGAGFCSLLKSLHVSFPFLSGVSLVSALAYTSLVGMLAFFAPAGLGVRETLLSLYLAHLILANDAVLAAAAVRVWQMALELVGFVVCLVSLKCFEVQQVLVGNTLNDKD